MILRPDRGWVCRSNVSNDRESDAQVMSPDEILARGLEYWQKIYTSGSQNLLDDIYRGYPDMGSFSFTQLMTSLLGHISCLWLINVIL
jgi:hypothetical protein